MRPDGARSGFPPRGNDTVEIRLVSDLEISTHGHLGRIALNRPKAINALSLEMIEGITAALESWRDDPGIGAVLFTGNGEKGFCSGGDVRAARVHVIAGTPEAADHYFATEYRMNGLIANYPKPTVALTHGIVMGGGIGIAGHCRYRLTQPGARFAMPEAAIGFFSDVGVNAILAKAPLNRALLFLMSGASVGAADAIALGLADAAIDPAGRERAPADLSVAAGAPDADAAIVRWMEGQSLDAGPTPFVDVADQLVLPAPCPAAAAFIEQVSSLPALSDISSLLSSRSPTALTAIFESQTRARPLTSVELVLEMDLRLARFMARQPDFAEGVRAVLVDKDQSPRWSPARLAEVDTKGVINALTTRRDPAKTR